MRDGDGRVLHPPAVAGMLAGIGVLYLTGLLVTRLMAPRASGFRRDPTPPTPRRSRTTRRRSTRSRAASDGPVGTSALAERLGVSPGTVTAMLKRMADLACVEYEPYQGVEPDPGGRAGGARGDPPHRLIEPTWPRRSGMPWDRVHDEAEVLEHYISEELEALDRRQARRPAPSTPTAIRSPSADLDLAEDRTVTSRRPRGRGDAAPSPGSPTATPRCCATSPSAGSRPGCALRVTGRAAVRRAGSGGRRRRHRACARRRAVETRCGLTLPERPPCDSFRSRSAEPARCTPRRGRGRGGASRRGRRRPRCAPLARRAVRGIARVWPFLGPAFIAAVAYIDPGNFATNIAGGAKFGYLLLWVVVAANLIAMLVQTQSAKLGIATGKNLPELCRETFSRRTSIGLWVQAEVVAMACDVAEVVGAALGLNLLFGIPLFPAALIAGAGAFAILGLQQMGFRRLEAGIAVLAGVVSSPSGFEISGRSRMPAKSAATCSCPASPAPRASC